SPEISGVPHRRRPARNHRQEAPVQSAHLREHNLSAILTALAAASATATPTSRAGLAKRTRLTKPTVSKLVEELVGADLVAEGDPIAAGTGRPMVPLTPAHGTLLAIGLEIAADHVACLGIDLAGTVLGHRIEYLKVTSTSAEEASDLAAELVGPVRAEAGELPGGAVGAARPGGAAPDAGRRWRGGARRRPADRCPRLGRGVRAHDHRARRRPVPLRPPWLPGGLRLVPRAARAGRARRRHPHRGSGRRSRPDARPRRGDRHDRPFAGHGDRERPERAGHDHRGALGLPGPDRGRAGAGDPRDRRAARPGGGGGARAHRAVRRRARPRAARGGPGRTAAGVQRSERVDRTGADDSRSMSWVSSLKGWANSPGSEDSASRRSMATCPIENRGWRTAVSCGWVH